MKSLKINGVSLTWKLLVKYSLIITLSLTQATIYHPLLAEDRQDTAEKIDIDKEMDRAVSELNRSFITGAENPLDFFQLTSQVLVDDRKQKLNAVIEQTLIDDYLERMADYKKILQKLEQDLEKLVSNPPADPKKNQKWQLKVRDITNQRDMMVLEIEDLKQFDPRVEGGERLPVEHMIDEHLATRQYFGKNLQLVIKDSNGKEVSRLQQKDFKSSLSPEFALENLLLSSEQDLRFEITSPKGQLFYQFLRPVTSVFFYGPYLVYTEKTTENKDFVSLRFIDLNYFKYNLANSPLPVFTFPLNIHSDLSKISIDKGVLSFSNQQTKLDISVSQIGVVSQLMRLIYNMNVALVNPDTREHTKDLVKEIYELLSKTLNAQEKGFTSQLNKALAGELDIKTLLGAAQTKLETDLRANNEEIAVKKAEVEKMLTDKKIDALEAEKLVSRFDEVTQSRSTLLEVSEAARAGQSLLARMKLLFQFMTSPRPMGSPTLLKSLAMVASGLSNQDVDLVNKGKEFVKQHPYTKFFKYGGMIGATAIMSQFLPEPYNLDLMKSFDLIRSIGDHLHGYMLNIDFGRNYLVLGQESFVNATSGVFEVHSSFLADGKWKFFLEGVFKVVIIPLKVFAGIHFAVNSFHIVKGMKAAEMIETGIVKSFIEYSKKQHKIYWDNAAKAEKEISGSANDVDLTDKEMELFRDYLARLKRVSVITQSLKNFIAKLNPFPSGDKAKENLRPDTLFKALKDVYISYPSLYNTFKFNALAWNVPFIVRSYAFTPSKWVMGLLYPNYFNITVETVEKKQHLPTVYNGGRIGWFGFLKRMIVYDNLQHLRAFEKSIAASEQKAMLFALRKAQLALIQKVENPESLLKIFDSDRVEKSGGVSTGISQLYNDTILILSSSEKMYFKAYFTRVFDESLKALLLEKYRLSLPEKTNWENMDSHRFQTKFVNWFAKEGKELNQSFTTDKLVEFLENKLNFQEIDKWSVDVTKKLSHITTRAEINYHNKLMRSIGPHNPQVKRYITAKTKVQEPRSMERAMRMEVASLLTSIPMGLATTLVMYAGIQTGMLQPFDINGLNTETHLDYMSRYLFYSGFVPGTIISFFANTWMKVQADARVSEIGGFSKIPLYKDTKHGFWRYYFKNVFKNPKNKWKDNQIYYAKLIFANIPAAMVTIGLSQYFGLGRIDVGAFMAGYIIIFTTMLIGIDLKIEQAFELASSWFYSKIPRKFRATHEAQQYLNAKIQMSKITFNIFHEAYSAIMGAVENMFALMDTLTSGTRSMLRLMFGGETLTLFITQGLEAFKEAFKAIPGVESVAEALKSLFSNKYEAFERFPSRLFEDLGVPAPAPDDPRFLEQTKLGAAKVVAIIIGFGTTIGSFTGIPYLASAYYHSKVGQRIQKKGEKILAQRRKSPGLCRNLLH